MAKMQPQNVELKVVEKQTKTGPVWELMDNEGYSCGFHASSEAANRAKRKVWLNLLHGSCKPYKAPPKSQPKRR